MSQDDTLDSHVSVQQCKRAVEALHAHQSKAEQKRGESELLPGKEQFFWLVLAVKKIHPTRKVKPYRIPIVHPLIDPRTTPICLITKDPQREYKDLLAAKGIKFISRVVGVAKLKGKFKPFEARRMLLKENGMFLADERVVPLLPPLLGTKFFQAKKQPIPVCLTREDLKGELERAVSSSYMHQNAGTCCSIKIGTLSQTPSQILANLKTALPEIVSHVHGGWSNIQSFHIKTNSSASLPVWQCPLNDGETGRWGGEVKETLQEGVELEWSGSESGGLSEADSEIVLDEAPVTVQKQAKKDAKAGPATGEALAAKKDKNSASAAGKCTPKVSPAEEAVREKAKKSKGVVEEAPPTSKKLKGIVEQAPATSKKSKAITDDVPSTSSQKTSKSTASEATPVVGKKSKKSKHLHVEEDNTAEDIRISKAKASTSAVAHGKPAKTVTIADTAAISAPKKATPAPRAPTPFPESAPTTAGTASSKSKKRKEPEPAPSAVPATGPGTPPKKQKRTKSDREPAADVPLTSSDPSSKPKKAKKTEETTPRANPILAKQDRLLSAASEIAKLASSSKGKPTPATAQQVEMGEPQPQKSKSKKDKKSQDAVIAPTVVRAYSPSMPVPSDPPETPAKGKKHKKPAKNGGESGVLASASVSVVEVKQKRERDGGEKKKEKLGKTKVKTGRSAKDELLGKKAGRVA